MHRKTLVQDLTLDVSFIHSVTIEVMYMYLSSFQHGKVKTARSLHLDHSTEPELHKACCLYYTNLSNLLQWIH